MADNRNFIQRLLNIGTVPEVKQDSKMMGYFGVDSSRRKEYNYQDLANEGYLKNAIFSQATRIRDCACPMAELARVSCAPWGAHGRICVATSSITNMLYAGQKRRVTQRSKSASAAPVDPRPGR